MSQAKHKKLITAQGVAELTGLSVKTILASKCGTDALIVIEAGRKKLYSLADVEEWIQRQVTIAKMKPKKKPKRKKKSKVIEFPSMNREEVKQMVAARTNEIGNSAPAEPVAALPPTSGDDAEPGEGIGRHAAR